MNPNYTNHGVKKMLYNYDDLPNDQLYRLELPNGQCGYDFITKINFNTKNHQMILNIESISLLYQYL